MKVGLSGLNLEAKGGGLDVYAKRLYRGLREEEIDVEPIWRGHPRTRLSKCLHSFVSQPMELAERYGNFDLIHATHPGMAFSFRFIHEDVPKVLTVHDLIPLSQPWTIDRPKGLKNRLSNKFTNYVFKLWLWGAKADKIIAVSSLTKRDLEERGFSPDKISVIPEYVGEKFRPIREPEEDVIGFFSALVHRKGTHLAIEAFAYMPEKYELWICGNPVKQDYFDWLMKIAGRLGVSDRIKFKGFIPEDELVETLCSFQCMLYPCYNDGFGLPILEAVKCGTPVVTLKNSRIPKETKSLCVEVESLEDMAEKARKISEEGRKEWNVSVPEEFSKKEEIRKTIEVYEAVIEG